MTKTHIYASKRMLNGVRVNNCGGVRVFDFCKRKLTDSEEEREKKEA